MTKTHRACTLPSYSKTIVCLLSSILISTLSVSVLAQEDEKEKAGFEYDFNGYLMLDRNEFDSIYVENGQEIDEDDDTDNADLETFIRRARLSLKLKVLDNWKAKFQIDVKDDIETKDAYIAYQAFDFVRATLGRQKQAFGLENLTSSRNLALSERAMVSDAFSLGRSTGFSLDGGIKKLHLEIGYFIDDTNEEAYARTGRISLAPLLKKNSLIHFGGSFSKRQLGSEEFRINERLEVYSSDSLLEGQRFTAVSSIQSGFEFIGHYKGFTSTAEWQRLHVRSENNELYKYKGGYYQLGYLITGKNRRYKEGRLGAISSKHSWETTLRLSQLYLINEDRSAQTLSLGLNYYPKKNVKLMFNYSAAIHTEADQDSDIGNAFKLRAQFEF